METPAVPAPSPMPLEDLSELMNIALGIGDDGDENAHLHDENDLDSADETSSKAEMGLSQSEVSLHRWLMFANSSRAREAMEKASKEYKLIRDQIMEEIEWQKQGLFDSKDGRVWMADRDDELKKLRLKLAAKRGWEAIRRYIREKQDDKQHQLASQNWKNMFKVAKNAAEIEDKTRLDLYERYGFLGMEKKQRDSVPEHNPMFPAKSVKLAKERALRLHQMMADFEQTESIDRVKAGKKTPRSSFSTNRRESRPSISKGVFQNARNGYQQFMPYIATKGSDVPFAFSRAVTMLSIANSRSDRRQSVMPSAMRRGSTLPSLPGVKRVTIESAKPHQYREATAL